MSFVGWALTAAMMYYTVGRTLFVAIDGVRRQKWGRVIALAAGVMAILLALPIIDRIPPADRTLVSRIPTLFVHFLIYLWVVNLAVKLLGRDRPSWQELKSQKRLSRQIKLHMALVTGAIVFSVPFYWLVTTSLKPDERTHMFPPDIIPMRQTVAEIGGEELKVYVLESDGHRLRVVKDRVLENDVWQVRVLGGDSRTLRVPRPKLEPELEPVALWSNYADALEFLPEEYDRGLVPLWNTIYVTLLTIVGTVLSSSLVAFSFARLRWPGRDLLFVILLATMMIPPAVTMLPVFLIFRSLGWVDTLKPLWVPAFFASAFNVFLLRQFFLTIPTDLEDAAKIDGCGYFTIYWKIMLPLIKPALAALTIFAFMGSWNNFMGPLIYISSPEKMTLAYALQLFQGAHGGEPAMMMAAATLVMLPVLAVFFFTQRYMIQGVTLTGIKG